MGLFDAILKDEEYENKVGQAQQQAAATHLDITGVGGGGGAGGGTGDPSSIVSAVGGSGGGGSGAGGTGGDGPGSGTGGGTGDGNGTGAGGVGGTGSGDGSGIVSDTTSTTDILSLTEEPLIITDETTIQTTDPNKSILDDIAEVTAAAENPAPEEEVIVLDTPEVTEVVEVIETETPETPEVIAEEVAVVTESVETSPAGVLRESIEKLERLEEIDKSVRDEKIEEAQGYKEKVNEYKILEKGAKDEAIKIEGEIEHIEEIISNFKKELVKEEQMGSSKAE